MKHSILLALFFLVSACAYEGPRVENMIPVQLESQLKSTVEGSKKAGIETLLVYGDSLSDPGNLSQKTFGLVLPHTIFYGGRFSNGPVWADYVAAANHWKLINHAVSGAFTYSSQFPESLVLDSLPEQIRESEGDWVQYNKSSTLVAIWIGPNNYLRRGGIFETKDGKTKPAIVEREVTKTTTDIEATILKLYQAGFRQIMLGTMPELGGINRSPAARITPTDESLFLATDLHNKRLREVVSRLKMIHNDLNVKFFHAFEINQKTYQTPKDYGFTVLNKPCFEGDLRGKFFGEEKFCSDPMGYKFWEYLHPNSMMHCHYATQFLSDLKDAEWVGGFDRDKALGKCKSIRDLVLKTMAESKAKVN